MSTYTDASLIYYPSGYKAGKAYSLKPTDGSGDLTFTRASTATRVNESGLIESVATGVPRIDFTGGGCGKLLLEPQRTNVSDNSENFSDWIQVGFTQTLNSTISPSNTLTADTFFESAGTTHIAFKDFSVTSGLNYTISFFLKSQGGRNVRILGSTGFSGSVDVNLSTGAILAGSGIVETFINGWYRVSINCNATTSTGRIILYSLDGTSSVEGDPTKGIICWGAQVEQGSYPTSYIPTTTTAVTRTQDSATKSGISSLIGQTEGTLFVDFVHDHNEVVNAEIFSLSDGSSANRVYIGNVFANNLTVSVTALSAAQFSANTAFNLVIGERYKVAVCYKLNDFAFYVNGVQIAVDTSGSVPLMNDFRFDSSGGSSLFFKPVQSVIIFPTRLSNAELATLTTI